MLLAMTSIALDRKSVVYNNLPSGPIIILNDIAFLNRTAN